MYYETKFGIDFLAYGYIVFWMEGGAVLSFYLGSRERLRASFWTLAGTVVFLFLFAEWTILPALTPFLSTKGLGQKLDQMVPPGEKLVFINSVKETALFYTNRRALVLRTPREVIQFLSSDKRVFCIVNKSLYKDLDKVRGISYIIEEEGGKVIISNRKESSNRWWQGFVYEWLSIPDVKVALGGIGGQNIALGSMSGSERHAPKANVSD